MIKVSNLKIIGTTVRVLGDEHVGRPLDYVQGAEQLLPAAPGRLLQGRLPASLQGSFPGRLQSFIEYQVVALGLRDDNIFSTK
jgi:hypothetical protein